MGSLVSQIFFCLQPGVNGHGSVCHEPCSKTNFLTIYFHWRWGSPTSVLGSQPIIWLLSPSPSGVRRPEVTKYQQLLISPLWPTFFLNGHFLTGSHCSFQREDSINLISIVSVGYHVTVRMPGDFAGHRFTRLESLVLCESMLSIVGLAGTNARRQPITLLRQPLLEKENSEFEPVKLRLKMTLCRILFVRMGW